MAAETRKSRKGNFSQEEIDVLITTVLQNHNILYGETSKSFFHKEIRNQVWNIILEEVNKVSLEKRTLNEVKNKWKKCQYNMKTTESVDYVDCDDLDSMPLQQRLSHNHNESSPASATQEPVLQSQPISPTKLKVTRQGAKPQQQSQPKAATPAPQNAEVCLRWNSHHSNMQTAFPSLLLKEQYVDATLVAEGKTLKCHRMILSSCSPYFEEILKDISPFQHPILFMKDVPFWALKALCDFMYAGEVHILEQKLQEILKVAEALKIKGLGGTSDTGEDTKPIVPEIKQEIEAVSPPKSVDKQLKEEKEDTVKISKKKDDKKSKHSSQTPKEKEREKEKTSDDSQAKTLPKVASKVVPKVVLPKVGGGVPKTTVKNVMKNVVQQKVAKPSTSKAAGTSRKNDKNKPDVGVQKDKDKEKEKPPLKKDNINDPLDLLEPVYEEIAKEEPSPMFINPAKLKERSQVPVRKGVNKKVRKRRYAEYSEDREESPPPVSASRKGTRSRPNIKIPKFYHTHYEDSRKEITDATIVREPHTDQSDPLIGVEEVEEIKAEPVDVEESTIDMEENLVNYMQDQEMALQEEEIIGNYDSPIVNIKQEIKSQPVILNIHTVEEGGEAGVRLLNINEENLKIVDISKISTSEDRLEETIIGKFDSVHSPQERTSNIMISSVQSMADVCEEASAKESEGGIGNTQKTSQGTGNITIRSDIGAETFGRLEEELHLVQIDNKKDSGAERTELDPLEPCPTSQYDQNDETPFRVLLPNAGAAESKSISLKIENVRSEVTSEGASQKSDVESLGSLEARFVTCLIDSQNFGSCSLDGLGDQTSVEDVEMSDDTREQGQKLTDAKDVDKEKSVASIEDSDKTKQTELLATSETKSSEQMDRYISEQQHTDASTEKDCFDHRNIAAQEEAPEHHHLDLKIPEEQHTNTNAAQEEASEHHHLDHKIPEEQHTNASSEKDCLNRRNIAAMEEASECHQLDPVFSKEQQASASSDNQNTVAQMDASEDHHHLDREISEEQQASASFGKDCSDNQNVIVHEEASEHHQPDQKISEEYRACTSSEQDYLDDQNVTAKKEASEYHQLDRKISEEQLDRASCEKNYSTNQNNFAQKAASEDYHQVDQNISEEQHSSSSPEKDCSDYVHKQEETSGYSDQDLEEHHSGANGDDGPDEAPNIVESEEMMSVGAGSQEANIEEETGELYQDNTEKNVRVDTAPDAMSVDEEESQKIEDSAADQVIFNNSDGGGATPGTFEEELENDCGLDGCRNQEDQEKNPPIRVQEPVKEVLDSIEDELEQCLASTSTIVPVKPPSDARLVDEVDDDFAQELLASPDNPTENKLDDDKNDVCSNSVVETVETEVQIIEASDGDKFSEACEEVETLCHAEKLTERPEGSKKIEIEEKADILETTENYDDRNLEESLLADLDEDIEMKDVASDDESAEKTLEMIVNDLNESLGEMKK